MEEEDSFNLPAFNLLPTAVVQWGRGGPKDKQRVQSLEFADNPRRLFVGSTEGRVFMYGLEMASDWEMQGKSLVNDKKHEGMSLGFGKKPVECLTAVPELDRLLVLCNENITSHNLADLSMRGPLSKAKGASLMCVGALEGRHYIVTVKKRKLLVWTLSTSGKEGVEPVTELELAEQPLRICMCGSSLCVGYEREYRIFRNIHTAQVEESVLFPVYTANRIPPYLATMDDESGVETMLISAEDMCMIVDSSGNPAGAPLVGVGGQVIAYARSRPYVVALQHNSIDVFNLVKQSRVQTIPCPEAFSAVADGGAGARGHGQCIFVASATSVYCLNPMPFEDQVDMLMGSFHVAQAFDLFRQTLSDGDSADLAQRAAKMRSDAAFCLLTNLECDQAIKHFKRSPIDVRELLVLVPDVLPKGALDRYSPKEQYNPMVKHSIHLEDMVKMALTRKTGNEIGEDEADMVEEQIRKAKLMLCHFFEYRRDMAGGGLARTHSMVFDDERMNLDGEAAVRPQRLDQDLLKVIETALLSLYIQTGKPNDFILEHIQRAGVLCGLTESVNPLMVGLKYTALGALYRVHGETKKALGVWKKLGSGKLKEEGCDGIVPTVELLAQLDDKELVLEFSAWVLERAPEQAVRIFAERSKATADLIPPTTVLELLSKLGSVVIQRYLEFIIHEQGNEEEAYHTQLATAYTDQALQGLASAAAHEVRQKLCDFLRSPACRTDFKRLLPKIQGTAMVDELVLLYRGMGQHDRALDVIVNEKKDFAEAKQYCLDNKPPHKHGDVPKSTFTDLLKIYFASVDSAMQEQAMLILKEQAAALDVVATLELLPTHTPMHLLTPWLTKALQDAVHQSRHLSVTTKLYEMENLRVKAKNAEVVQKASARPARRPAAAAAAPAAQARDEPEPAEEEPAEEEEGEEEGGGAGSLPRESTGGDLMSGW